MKTGRYCAGRKRGGLEELDSKGGDVGGNVSGDEAAAWRDLVARYDLPADVDPAHAPWPDAENLGSAAAAQQTSGAVDQDQRPAVDHDQWPVDGGGPGAEGRLAEADARVAEADGRAPGADARAPGADARVPGADGRPAGADETDDQTDGPPRDARARETPDRARVIRHAAPPPQPPAEDEPDDRYIPPPPPPLPNLDPVTKGAWTALAGGPAYLLVATIAGWQIPGWAAFLAVAAFITGFTLIVLRMSDKRPEDDDNNGAVL
jgi:hypothetical protein